MSSPPGGGTNPLRDIRDTRIMRIAGPCSLVIFGVTGDLARRKLMPAVYDLANRGLLPPGFALVGFGRRTWSDAEFAAIVEEAVRAGARTPFRRDVWERLAYNCRFVTGEFDDADAYSRLGDLLGDLERGVGTAGNAAFYLSVPPSAFATVLENIRASGLATPPSGSRWRRVVIEKPFGHDLHSARELNAVVNSVFDEESVFRIDHYLGKETVQNILALRFANRLFEPLWNAGHVDHVQITMAEDIGLGGRAGYYDGIGAARDVIQNHLLQLLALVAMDRPTDFTPSALRNGKLAVLRNARIPEPFNETTARGQYTAGWQGGTPVAGLAEEVGFDPHSTTETFAAVTVEIDDDRWRGVPFYLRSGKRLGRRVTEIAVVYERAEGAGIPSGMTGALGANALVIRIQPDEGVLLRMGSKVPGSTMEVRDVNMDFSYGESFTQTSPEAYERLILDVLLGVPSLFPVNEEVEESWRILDPVLECWAESGSPEPYRAGTWGPSSADDVLARDGRSWRRP